MLEKIGQANEFLKNKRVLVTGACGTVGSELTRQLIEKYEVEFLLALDNNESELFFLEQKFSKIGNTNFVLCDIRDRDKLTTCMKKIDIVFHAAAFKHVIFCERSPFEAVQTNIIGVHNIIMAASASNVEKVIFTSSDKAVNPTSVMGTTKLMGERIITAANSNGQSSMILASTRFGNVLGSRGSVIPIFYEQINNGGPVTLTSEAMTRFIMSISQAVKLVIESAQIAKGGEVFITKMPVIRILDLAEVMINELATDFGHDPSKVNVDIIGTKPGEKMYEELMSDRRNKASLRVAKLFRLYCQLLGLYIKKLTTHIPMSCPLMLAIPITLRARIV